MYRLASSIRVSGAVEEPGFYSINDLKLPIVGLMCIPTINDEPAMHFALLKKIASRNKLLELSSLGLFVFWSGLFKSCL